MPTSKEPLHTLVVGCLVRNAHDEVLLQVLLNFDGTINYRSYTLKPYQVVLERDLGGM